VQRCVVGSSSLRRTLFAQAHLLADNITHKSPVTPLSSNDMSRADQAPLCTRSWTARAVPDRRSWRLADAAGKGCQDARRRHLCVDDVFFEGTACTRSRGERKRLRGTHRKGPSIVVGDFLLLSTHPMTNSWHCLGRRLLAVPKGDSGQCGGGGVCDCERMNETRRCFSYVNAGKQTKNDQKMSHRLRVCLVMLLAQRVLWVVS
jgi:hypothetical protein